VASRTGLEDVERRKILPLPRLEMRKRTMMNEVEKSVLNIKCVSFFLAAPPSRTYYWIPFATS
jgi:hypothetical protein